MSGPGRRVVLNFHGLGAPGRDLEPGEDAYWIPRDFYEAILDRAAERRPGDLPVEITFDDGNASDLAIGAPGLEARGMTGTFFVLAGRLGAPGSLSEADLRALAARGRRIGTHGMDHVDWRAASDAVLAREIGGSLARLAEVLGRPVEAAAIPFGRYDGRVIRALRKAGLREIHTSDGGTAGGGGLVPRTSIRRDMTLDDVSALIEGREPLPRRLRRALSMAVKRRLAI